MNRGRLEAFSDGVIAIIITIMVLEIHVPQGTDLAALRPLLPTLLSYMLSFVFVGIYWNNHHHLMQAVGKVNGAVLWANLHLLFWMSLFPFVTHWMGQSHFTGLPVALYGVVLLLAAAAYFILTRVLRSLHGEDSRLAAALGSDLKGRASLAIYVIAVGLSFWRPLVSCALYVVVAGIWLVPDLRFERTLASDRESGHS
jgi:uncharacterized membrane protein